jgi:hypothetical protein
MRLSAVASWIEPFISRPAQLHCRPRLKVCRSLRIDIDYKAKCTPSKDPDLNHSAVHFLYAQHNSPPQQCMQTVCPDAQSIAVTELICDATIQSKGAEAYRTL